MSKIKQSHKLTDEQFAEAFIESQGNFSLTSQYIQQKYRLPYSKQAVYDRALRHPELLDQMEDIFEDHCTMNLITFAEDAGNDVRLRSRLFSQMINNLNKRQRRKATREKMAKKKAEEEEPLGYFQIGDYKMDFTEEYATPQEGVKKILDAIKRADEAEGIIRKPEDE